MGTNYYTKINNCDKCGRYDKIHLGKSSAGWQFYFQYNGGKYYKKHCIQPPSKPPYTHPKYDRSLELVLDNNKRHYTYAFWCGSFETLHKVSIEVVEPELSQFIFEW